MEQERLDKDPNSWWNKIRTLTFDEAKTIPKNYLFKYMEISEQVKTFYDETHVIEREIDPRYQEHHNMTRLITDKEREDRAIFMAKREAGLYSPNTHSEEINTKQPRNTGLKNYNFEQYKGFTRMYNEQMEKERQKDSEIKRIWKYIKEHPDEAISKTWKRKLLFGEKADDMPIESFVDDNVSIEGFKPSVSRKVRRPIIRTRTSRDISDYDCWRVCDRQMMIEESTKNPVSKITLSPTDLIHCFGTPLWNPNPTSTGLYYFEDNNLDLYVLIEPHSTQDTRGMNKDDEFYENQKYRVQHQKREKKYPTLKEFWETDMQRVFYIFTTPYAEYRKFKVWLRKHIKDNKDESSFEQRMNEKYGNLYSLYDNFEEDYDKYNDRSTETMPIFNYTWADFLDAKEKKKVKNDIPELPTPAEFLPFDKAEKMQLTKEQLEDMYNEERRKHDDQEL